MYTINTKYTYSNTRCLDIQSSRSFKPHLGDLADTMQLRQNTLPALATHITNRIKKFTVVLNAAADRRDRVYTAR